MFLANSTLVIRRDNLSRGSPRIAERPQRVSKILLKLKLLKTSKVVERPQGRAAKSAVSAAAAATVANERTTTRSRRQERTRSRKLSGPPFYLSLRSLLFFAFIVDEEGAKVYTLN